MTALGDVILRLSRRECRPVVVGSELHVRGRVKGLTEELLRTLHLAKPALMVELLRQKASELTRLLDGEAPYADRLARAPEYLETLDRLAAAQQVLLESWRRAGFTVVWSLLVEEFLLVGAGEPPLGSEAMAVYTWEEMKLLEGANPDAVRQVHRLKRAFGGGMQRREA